MKRALFSNGSSDGSTGFALLLLRLCFGGLMAVSHGYEKLTHYSEMKGQFLHFLGLSSPISLGLNIFAEFLCGILVALGLFTRWATIPLIIAMCVALFLVHGGDVMGKGQAATLYLVAYVALFFTGAGRYSFDTAFNK